MTGQNITIFLSMDFEYSNMVKDTLNSAITFVTSLLVGAIGIHYGAIAVLGGSEFTFAVIAALIGATVWGLASFFSGWIPLLGSLITFLAWLITINLLYGGGLIAALQIAIIAWIISVVILFVLSLIGLTDTRAIGVPGA